MLNILYIDNHLICLDKPTGLLTQPSGTDRDSLEEQAKAWIKAEYNKPGAVFLEAVHRIDSVACGIVMFARTSKALSRMTSYIREGKCSKVYRLLVQGCPSENTGTLKNWMLHKSMHAQIVDKNTPDAKLATLSYKVLEKRAGNITLIQVNLESGRYHQIRAQFGHIGCPIVGDAKYGSKMKYKDGGIALQHYCLAVEHPVSHEPLTIYSKITL